MGVSRSPISISKMSEREGVGSLEMIKVFFPWREKCRAMAEAQVVFPTPPFPPIMIRRFCSLSNRFNEGLITPSKGIDFKDIKLYNKLFSWSRYSIKVFGKETMTVK